jgi:hypothetical protein
MKIFNTKYALTDGIKEYEVEVGKNEDIVKIGSCSYLHGEGKEWHRTIESANKRAEEMRQQKIKSLEKQLDKLKKLRFE